MSAHRTYSDRERATALAALAANGGNVSLTAKQLSLPRKTLVNWQAGQTSPEVAELGQEKKKELADCLEEIAYTIVGAMPGKVSGSNLQQLATSAAIAIDKMRLLREQPTSIAVTESVDAAIERELARLAGASQTEDAGAPARPTVN